MAIQETTFDASPASVGDTGALNFGTGVFDPTTPTTWVGRSGGIEPENALFLRFDIQIPKTATVRRVRLQMKSAANAVVAGGGTRDVGVGWLVPDGKWNLRGFNTTDYPDRSDLPHPTTAFSNAIIPGRLIFNSWLGAISYQASQLTTGTVFSIGDADYSPTFPLGNILGTLVDGIVHGEAYDPDNPETRYFGLVLDSFFTDAGEDRFFVYTENHSTQPGPKLIVEWDDHIETPRAAPRTTEEIRAELDKVFPSWAQGMEGVDDLILHGIAAMFSHAEAVSQTLHERAFICLADGSWLDQHGEERGIGRSSGEEDEEYRARVSEIEDAVTPNAIANRLALVVERGDAKIIEWVGDGPFLMDNGETSPKGWFLTPTYMPTGSRGFFVEIQPQDLLYDDSLYLVDNGGGTLGGVSNFLVDDGEGHVGAFLGASGLPASSIYERIYREVNRARAFGVEFVIFIEE